MKLPIGRSLLRAAVGVGVIACAAPIHAEPARADAIRLLEASGLDELLRVDAALDEKLKEALPPLLPSALTAEDIRKIDQSMGYAGMRKAISEALSRRFDPAAVDQQLRWWSSPTGKSVAAAQVAAFRELTGNEAPTTRRFPAAPARVLSSDAPLAVLLPKLAQTSRSTRECLRLLLNFRRLCADATGAPPTNAAEVLMAHYSKLSNAEDAAFRAYLKTPGAREASEALADVYLKTRTVRFAETQRAIEDALAQFARNKVGSKSEADAMLKALISRIDADDSLDEVNLLLHFWRSQTPRDPRVYVELARVSIKRGNLHRPTAAGQPGAVDPGYLDDARSWIDRAIALDPKRADTLVLAGHVAYLEYKFDDSIAILEEARRVGTDNPWLSINLADALWASAQRKNDDRALLSRAARELSTVLEKQLTYGMRQRANSALSLIYSDLRDVAKGRPQFERWVAQSRGFDKGWALHEQSRFLFFKADDLDAAIAAARQADVLGGAVDGGVFLGQMLLVKAAKLYGERQPAVAAKLVKEAQLENRAIVQNYSSLAYLPQTLPGLFALQKAGVIADLSGAEGGLALVYAARYANAAEVERLIQGRADPNYLSPEYGTPLNGAIMGRNLPAMKVLLAHGADTTLRNREGLLPLEQAEFVMRPADPRDAEIVATLRNVAKGGAAAEPIGEPLRKGYVYQVLRRFSSEQNSHTLEVGTRVTFDHNCNSTDPNLACLDFKHPDVPGVMLDVTLEKSQLVSWQEWFKEIGPAPAR